MRRYCGRDFSPEELEVIRLLISSNPQANRVQLSRMVCEKLGWIREHGKLKDMSCRVAMLRMQEDDLIQLPPPLKGNGNGKRYRRRTRDGEPSLFPIDVSAGELRDVRLSVVGEKKSSHLWNEFIDRYHYLRYQPLPGAQLRYFAWAEGEIVAALGFGAAAWKVAARDRFIGWTVEQRQSRLHLVVNNARFLILPWVRSRHLASKLIAMSTRRLAADWNERYGYSPALVETFVEIPRFRGTCYKAANWKCVGETQGRGKLDVKKEAKLPKKSIWVYPLRRRFRRALCQ